MADQKYCKIKRLPCNENIYTHRTISKNNRQILIIKILRRENNDINIHY